MAINAGELRHRLRIDRRQVVEDSNGDPVQDPVTGEISYEWAEVGKRWGKIRAFSGREFVAAQATQSRVTSRITVRTGRAITASDRIVHLRKDGNVVYDIHAVLEDPDSGEEYVTLMVSRGVNNG